MATPTPFTLPHFLDWVREQPGEAEYDVTDPGACALAQFGYPGAGLSSLSRYGIPEDVYLQAVCGAGPDTFSALAKRLEALSQGDVS